MITTHRPGTRRVSTPVVTAVVCLALGAVAAAMASLNVALPDLARSTQATQTQLEWIIDAYSLVFAALLLPGGALGDRYGRRRALLTGLIIFGGASAAAMTASTGNELIALRGVTGLGAALAVLPLAGSMMPTARVTPRLAARFGARNVCITGLLLVAAGLAVISRVGTASPYWLLVAGLIPLGVGMGAAMTPATAAITDGLPAAQQGVGSALNDLSREVGGALGIAVIGSIVTAVYRSRLHLPAVVPAALASKARGSFALAIHAGGPVKTSAGTAFVDGIHTGLLYAAGAALLAAIIVGVLVPGGLHDRHAADSQARGDARDRELAPATR